MIFIHAIIIYIFSGILLCVIGFSLGDVESEFKNAKIEPDIIDKAPVDKIEVCISQIVRKFAQNLTRDLIYIVV